jgi:hypothetical protein
LLWAHAAPAASTSTEARTPERTRFIQSLPVGTPHCFRGLDVRCGNHAVSGAQRQAAGKAAPIRVFPLSGMNGL